jgi:hypothetical protein
VNITPYIRRNIVHGGNVEIMHTSERGSIVVKALCYKPEGRLRHYATSRKVAESRPDEVDFF